MAARHFPENVRFDINETSRYWFPHKEKYSNLIRRLLDAGAKIGGIGMQFHMFSDEEMARLLLGELYPPEQIFAALDRHARFGLPLHVSEITLTAPGNSPEGLAAQADAARNFYRLWFSHPAVAGITWWNVPDGGAAPGEDNVFSGLLFRDLTPKPSYEALHELLHCEWRTEATGLTGSDGCFHFRGFHGAYTVGTDGSRRPETLRIEPDQSDAAALRFCVTNAGRAPFPIGISE